MPLAFSYPLMKRYTYWPQLFLGITFNYGLILGWTSIKGQIDIVPILIYIGAIFWTLGYDTIYGFQDIKDDEIIGLKSTSIKFKSNPYIFLSLCFLIFLILLTSTGYLMSLSLKFFFFVLLIFIHMFYFQLFKLNISNPNSCLHTFKSNNFLGFLIYIALIIGKY
jgi:4-hydroxybenzoate polyprenyltransferase